MGEKHGLLRHGGVSTRLSHQMEDSELAVRAAEGDHAAFEVLVRRNADAGASAFEPLTSSVRIHRLRRAWRAICDIASPQVSGGRGVSAKTPGSEMTELLRHARGIRLG